MRIVKWALVVIILLLVASVAAGYEVADSRSAGCFARICANSAGVGKIQGIAKRRRAI